MVAGDESAISKLKKSDLECPQCGHVQSIEDFLNLNLDAARVYKDCLGRYVNEEGCPFSVDDDHCLPDKVRIVVTRNGNESKVFNFI
ncbi:VVA0879 family protein [Laceyella tengchongensis]|uniref:VVA0879 family protein n=1 Tax=Laceyella tengchongensis TaxID=574699 RepID=UPI003A52110B